MFCLRSFVLMIGLILPSYSAESYVCAHASKPEIIVPFIENMCALDSAEAWWIKGCLYLDGMSYERDTGKANHCFEKAAALGFTAAYTDLADSYFSGQGAPEDKVLARILYQKAALLGDGRAAFHLAVMLRDGFGGPVDLKAAHMWFQKAYKNPQNKELQEAIGALIEKLSGSCP